MPFVWVMALPLNALIHTLNVHLEQIKTTEGIFEESLSYAYSFLLELKRAKSRAT